METLVLIIHIIVAILLVAMILLQQGKGADAGASFGAGASQTVFGSRGSSGFLVKLTAIMAALLLITSISLYLLTRQKAKHEADGNITLPVTPKHQSDTQPASDAPVIKKSVEKKLPAGNSNSATAQKESTAKDKNTAIKSAPAENADHKKEASEPKGVTGTAKPAKDETVKKAATTAEKAPVEKADTSAPVNQQAAKTEKKAGTTEQSNHSEHTVKSDQKK